MAYGLTYDTGALLAAEKNDRLLWALHDAALSRGLRPTVPCGVLAESWRGGPQAQMSRLLRGCRIEPLDEAQARAVGVIARASRMDDTVDLAVAEGAIRRSDAVVTSNRTHIERAADSVGAHVEIHDV